LPEIRCCSTTVSPPCCARPLHSEPGARTQYRQLLDLLGSMPPGASSELAEAAYDRLGALAEALPQAVQSAILRAPGLRLRKPPAGGRGWRAASRRPPPRRWRPARLSESDWLYLIPRLPMTARASCATAATCRSACAMVLDPARRQGPRPARARPAGRAVSRARRAPRTRRRGQ
jgi:hypothetical protein